MTQSVVSDLFQLNWNSLSGYTAYRLQKSCLGNGLNTTAQKVATYVPRILVAFPLLMVCAALDLAFLALKPILVVMGTIICCDREYFYFLDTPYCMLCDFISTIALPIVLLGNLLLGKIPESQRLVKELRGISTNDYQIERLMDNIDMLTEERLHSIIYEALVSPLLLNRIKNACIASNRRIKLTERDFRRVFRYYSLEILKAFIEVPGCNPLDISGTFHEGFGFSSCACSLSSCHFSLAEYVLKEGTPRGLKNLISLFPEIDVDYDELAVLLYFFEHPETDLNTEFQTVFIFKEGSSAFVTSPLIVQDEGIEKQKLMGKKTKAKVDADKYTFRNFISSICRLISENNLKPTQGGKKIKDNKYFNSYFKCFLFYWKDKQDLEFVLKNGIRIKEQFYKAVMEEIPEVVPPKELNHLILSYL
jgi:hypothetical protein